MAGNNFAFTIAVTIILVCITNYSVFCINTKCQGTECTLEDLGLDTTTGEKVLQNLTSTISKILESQLRIHITHEYNNSSCGTVSKPGEAPSTDSSLKYARDCGDIAAQGHNKSGVYKVRPKLHAVASSTETDESEFEVYCDLDEEGSAWTVFQQRQDGSVDFYRGWEDYKRGFGYFEKEFWLGLEKLYRLTTQDYYRLKVTLEDADGNETYATYNNFRLGDESTSFKLLMGSYEGTAQDSLRVHAEKHFSTRDKDNDVSSRHCAEIYKGGWWYEDCHKANLNGLYLAPGSSTSASGVTWYYWKNSWESLKSTAMKIQRMP